MIIAGIAYKQLSPGTRERLVEVLTHHPDYERWIEEPQLPQRMLRPSSDLGLYLFMKASTWPDEIRGREGVSRSQARPDWHFIEIPLTRQGMDGSYELRPSNNILEGIAASESSLRSPQASAADRAISLSWLLHLIGDAHQPLHCATMSGDHGGNRVRVVQPGNPMGERSLHAVWDALLGGALDRDIGDVTIAMEAIESVRALTLNDLRSDAGPADWVARGARKAFEVAYLSGAVGNVSDGQAFVLPANYFAAATDAAREGASLAGLHLARVLEGALPVSALTSAVSPSIQKEETFVESFLQGVFPGDKPWWRNALAALGGMLALYAISVVALLISAAYGNVRFSERRRFFSPVWLISKATTPLLVTPGLGRSLLFLGYRRRLSRKGALRESAHTYFGLPMRIGTNSVEYDKTGRAQEERICGLLRPGRPVLISGKGGAGKSTLLAHLAIAAAQRKLPDDLRDLLPIHVPAYYYRTSLAQAICQVLCERDGVNVTEEIVRSQLQTGPFLVLLDGLSEIGAEGAEQAERATDEIWKFTQNVQFATTRFVISSRPLTSVPDGVVVVDLMPLTPDVINTVVEYLQLTAADSDRLRRQLQSFHGAALEPLLFAMALGQGSQDQVSRSRTELYERYFCRLLQLDAPASSEWQGLRVVLEHIAEWTFLHSGRRGHGLRFDALVERLLAKSGSNEASQNLIEKIEKVFGVALGPPYVLLQRLTAAGLMVGENRRRFAHDTFEEFFAARRIAALVGEREAWPELAAWRGKEVDLEELTDFLVDIVDENELGVMLNTDLPTQLRRRLLSLRPEAARVASTRDAVRFISLLEVDDVSLVTLRDRHAREPSWVPAVEWPLPLLDLKRRMSVVIADARRPPGTSALFHGWSRAEVAEYLESALLTTPAMDQILDGAPAGLSSILSGTTYYFGVVPQESLRNFMVLCVFTAGFDTAYMLARVEPRDSPLLAPWRPYFEPQMRRGTKMGRLFGVTDAIWAAQLRQVSNLELVPTEYFYGPKWMLEEFRAATERPITTGWFATWVIPQTEIRRIRYADTRPVQYDERATTTLKFLNEQSQEV